MSIENRLRAEGSPLSKQAANELDLRASFIARNFGSTPKGVQDEFAALPEENKQLRAEVERLQTRLAQFGPDEDALLTELIECRKQIVANKEQLEANQKELDRLYELDDGEFDPKFMVCASCDSMLAQSSGHFACGRDNSVVKPNESCERWAFRKEGEQP